MENYMEKLAEMLEWCLNAMKRYPGKENFGLRNNFYHQAFGAASFVELATLTDEAMKLWQSKEEELNRALWET